MGCFLKAIISKSTVASEFVNTLKMVFTLKPRVSDIKNKKLTLQKLN